MPDSLRGRGPVSVTEATTDSRAQARRVTAVVGILSLAVFMSSLDLFIVNLAFPYISRDYPGTSLSSLSWVLNAYTIVFAAVLVPAGRWADRIGRRALFSGGLILFSFGLGLCGLVAGGGARGHGCPRRCRCGCRRYRRPFGQRPWPPGRAGRPRRGIGTGDRRRP